MSRIGKSIETEGKLVVFRHWAVGAVGSECLMGSGFLFRMVTVLELEVMLA